jgi:uncharacterized membrane-anchored protein
MTTLEKEQLKAKLTEKMSEFIEEVTHDYNEIGYVPENIEALMSDAAFSVLQTATATNQYFKDQDMLKD